MMYLLAGTFEYSFRNVKRMIDHAVEKYLFIYIPDKILPARTPIASLQIFHFVTDKEILLGIYFLLLEIRLF